MIADMTHSAKSYCEALGCTNIEVTQLASDRPSHLHLCCAMPNAKGQLEVGFRVTKFVFDFRRLTAVWQYT